ncbi:MAG: indole-3-glycerol phosphate synthase TrpC [Dehalococcoidales bacterium]|nr:indole-3-glycerol phosphate synthase TrpC [Dehalococcoidales bacterium]
MILDDIVAAKRSELAAAQRRTSLLQLQRLAQSQSPALDFAASLLGEDIRLIAEIKKASPSAGLIRADFNPREIAQIYADNGAAAISVLTETKYFKGSLDYLKDIRDALGDGRVPLLRKDFIFDPYQVYEALAYGADSLLLIAAILTPDKLKNLLALSREIGMEPMVEVHDEAEVKVALESNARIIGINNRDLKTFKTDLSTTERLRPLIPEDRVVVSESGIKNHNHIAKLRQWGVNAVLIGESLMASHDITAKMRELFPPAKARP